MRLVAAPLLAVVFWLPQWTIAPVDAIYVITAILFIIAAITDFIDGYWARKKQQQTAWGKFLDPVADKILVTTALLLLANADQAPIVACMLIICREVFVSALREWAAINNLSSTTNVSIIGKIKTVAQMVAIPCLFIAPLAPAAALAGAIILWIAAIFALWSMIEYSRSVWQMMKKN